MNEYVWYCPECDGLHISPMGSAFLFDAKGGMGQFAMFFEKGSFKLHDFYLIGEL